MKNFLISSEREIITNFQAYRTTPQSSLKDLLNFRKNHKIRVLEINGGKIDYIITEKKEKTLLMFHGALGSAETPWREINRLKNKFTIITPTIKGFSNFDQISFYVNEILEHEKIDSVIIRGGSFGAFVAQAYLRRNHKKVEGLILINGLPPQGPYSKKDMRAVKLFNLLLKLFPGSMIKKMMNKKLGNLIETRSDLTESQKTEIEFLNDQVKERLIKASKKSISELFKLAVEFDLNEKYDLKDLADWQGKTLLITDEQDSSYKHFDNLLGLYPDIKSHIFKNSGHLLQIIHKQEFEKIIDNFLELPRN